jgi:hypothetical protein
MKIVEIAVLIVLSVFAINCGDKPPQDPSTVVDTDASAPASPAPPPAPSN